MKYKDMTPIQFINHLAEAQWSSGAGYRLACRVWLAHNQEVASTKPPMEQIPFGPHLTCSQCGKACLDHYSVSNNVWCPECAAGRIHPTGQPPQGIILPPPMEVAKEELALRARRARLLECIGEAEESLHEYGYSIILQDLKDELAAVESALGYPEPKEPAEANQEVLACVECGAGHPSPTFCPICLSLYEHEDPMQSCQCDEDDGPDSASDETITRH